MKTMKTNPCRFLFGLLAASLFAGQAAAQSSSFNYQGRLSSAGAPVNSPRDFRFRLYDNDGMVGTGILIGPELLRLNTPISNGLFAVELDFGAASAFNGASRWIEVAVSPAGAGSYTTITPRVMIGSAPYAIRATAAGTATTVAANGVGTSALLLNAVNSARIADGTIAPSDLGPTLLSNTFWRLGGNAGATPGTQFLGTTDGQPLAVGVNGVERLRVGTNGHVGIGITTPGASLEVIGGIRAKGGQPGANGTNNAGYAFSGVGGGDTDSGMFSTADGQLEFYNNSGERMRIHSNGNVGIGTTNPQSLLHVGGTAQVDASLNFGASTRQMLNLYSSLFGIGVQDYRLYFRTGPPGYGNGFEWFSGGQHTATAGDPGAGGTQLMQLKDDGLTVRTPIKALGGLIIESRTNDPPSPVNGQMWLITNP